MGLDMYLKRTKRLPGFKTQDYLDLDDKIYGSKTLEEAKGKIELEYQDLVAWRGRLEVYTWLSIFEEVAYWCKANAIHKWFVDNVQSGVDECQHAEVAERHLKKLLVQVRTVLQEPKDAERLLPTQGGFFFGGTGYDEYYIQDLEDTERQLIEVLKTTDWDKQIIFYHSSW